MRELHEYRLKELVQLTYLKDILKQLRNDFVLRRYLSKAASDEQVFLDQCKKFTGRNVISVIAFEQPLVLDWLLALSKIHLSEFEILVFDNSRRAELRREIEQVCRNHEIPYLALPVNRTRHVNRSHGLAMTWVYQRIISNIKPKYFGFLDHDMLPITKIGVVNKLERQPVYGLVNRGIKYYWNLWAGYCFFDFSFVSKLPLNFLYDFTRYLDTGGRNWDSLYKKLNQDELDFAPTDDREIKLINRNSGRVVQFVDDQWIHIGGVGYNNNFNEKREFFTEYFSQIK